MLRKLATLALTLLAPLLVGCGGGVAKQYRPQGEVTQFSYDDWAKVLQASVTPDGYVRHDLIKANEQGTKDALLRFVGQIGAVSPLNRPELFPTREAKFAYWINAYNAVCMYAVHKRGLPGNVIASVPPAAIFFVDSFPVGGRSMTLNTIEKQYGRSFEDPRLHFALNCMSQSCPPLLAEPFDPARLDEQLTAHGHRSMNDPRCAVAKGDGQTVRLNEIFTKFWTDDFLSAERRRTGKRDVTLLESLRPLAGPDSPVQTATRHESMGYDWGLNRPPGKKG